MLKTYLTHYLDSNLGGHLPEIRHRWGRAAAEAGAPLAVVKSRPYETHGDLLCRIWNDYAYDDLRNGSDVLISETDFVPDPAIYQTLEDMPGFVFAHYLTRDYQRGDSVEAKPGRLQRHAIRVPGPDDKVAELPLTGAWFMKFPAGAWAKQVPFDWLGAASRFNDAANFAYVRLLESKVRDIPIGFLKPTDLWHMVHGVDYPGLGAHMFFSRGLDEPDDTVICWPDCKPGLTAGRHREGIRRFLQSTAPDAKLSLKACKERAAQ